MKVNASTLTEFVLAMAIIGTCFSIAAVIFSRTNRSTIQFKEVADQTEFQSLIFEQYILDTIIEAPEWKSTETELEIEQSKAEGGLENYRYIIQSSDKKIWEQEFYKSKQK